MKSEDRAAKFPVILDNEDWETNAHVHIMKADSLPEPAMLRCFRKLLVGSSNNRQN